MTVHVRYQLVLSNLLLILRYGLWFRQVETRDEVTRGTFFLADAETPQEVVHLNSLDTSAPKFFYWGS